VSYYSADRASRRDRCSLRARGREFVHAEKIYLPLARLLIEPADYLSIRLSVSNVCCKTGMTLLRYKSRNGLIPLDINYFRVMWNNSHRVYCGYCVTIFGEKMMTDAIHESMRKNAYEYYENTKARLAYYASRIGRCVSYLEIEDSSHHTRDNDKIER
jgi:hypothetical protein